MQLVDWFLVVALVSVGVGIVVALVQYCRGRMTLLVCAFTTIGLFGLAVAALARLVGASRIVGWVGLSLTAFAFYCLGWNKNARKVGAGRTDPR
jgi:hypothetical protein